MEEVQRLYEEAQQRQALIAFPGGRSRTVMAIADSHKGVNVKTQISLSCEGIHGYLGTIVVHPRLEAHQYASAVLLDRDWVAVRYQFHWFEWLHDVPTYQRTRVHYSGVGKCWKIMRMVWEPGLPSHDDYDIQCDQWLQEDVEELEAVRAE